ncbi:MAG: flavodoxin family protein [Methanolinea sp.]|nr:flavodoxin family protein [Methanolinea sp.]
MKVLGLSASPRAGESRTLQLVNAVLQGAESMGAETELVDIYSLEIGYCTACDTCHVSGDCTLIDDFPDLLEKMMNADGIVLGSPNYIDSIAAPLKAVFDRMAGAIHCQMLTGKYACAVCTSGGTNYEGVVEYMNHVLSALGATTVGGVGVSLGRDPLALNPAKKGAMDLGKTLVRSIRGEIRYPEQETYHRQRRDYFWDLVKFNRDNWVYEYDWYVRKGWKKEGE